MTMAGEFEWNESEPESTDSGGSHVHWERVLAQKDRMNSDTFTGFLDGAEFWTSAGNPDLEMQEIVAECTQIGLEVLFARCNNRLQDLEISESWVSAAHEMLNEWREKVESGDTAPVMRPSVSSIGASDEHCAAQARDSLPFSIRTQQGADELEKAIASSEAWIVATRGSIASDQAKGVFVDYWRLHRSMRDVDRERVLAGQKTDNLPWHLQQAHTLVDASASGTRRPTQMAGIARLVWSRMMGKSQNDFDAQRRQQRAPQRRNSGGRYQGDEE